MSPGHPSSPPTTTSDVHGGPVPGKALVTGASGAVSNAVLAALRPSGAAVRALSRGPQTVAGWKEQGIDAATGSLDDLDGALQGCEQMFLLSAAAPDQHGQDRARIDAAAATGVVHVVKLSSGDAVGSPPISWARGHASSDAYLHASGTG